MHGVEKSDNVILPKRQANNDPKWSAELEEGRTLTKGNFHEPVTAWTQSQSTVSPGLMKVRHVARTGKERRLTALLHHVTPDILKSSYRALKRRAAPGVDGVTWESYGEDLTTNISDLHARLHNGSYRANPARRVHIDKADGSKRPLSILCLEDKIAQHAVSQVLHAIYEEELAPRYLVWANTTRS